MSFAIYRGEVLHFDVWVDGGTLGKNPSTTGVYWSVYGTDHAGQDFLIREESYSFFTNNEAEYLALGCALDELLRRGALSATIQSDSRLIVNQTLGKWKVKNDVMKALHLSATRRLARLAERGCTVEILWIPRLENVEKLGH